ERTPHHAAVLGAADIDMAAVTYRQLNEKANQLARALNEKGVAGGDLVAVIMNRSIDMVMAVMAILKAGGAYVPLEPYLPDTRIQKILASLGVNILLTDDKEYHRVESMSESLEALETILCPGGKDREEISVYSVDNLAPTSSPVDFAYIIFTSGSTGTPKGVVETHQPVVNVIEWVNRTFNVGQPDKLLFIASLGFDLSVYDIFGVLSSGACLRVVEAADIKDPERLLKIIIKEGITFWDSAPAALQQLVPFLDDAADCGECHAMRLIFLSGDWIPVALPDALKEAFSGVQVISLGGATEATIWSNFHPNLEVDPRWPSIPYGKPIQNAKYYILDQHVELCPIRVPGDLYIGGRCLSSGYLNDPLLTAGKFIDNPFVTGENLYKTGDMARWFSDGNMEFLGRKDHQVKVRGFRIELGEIESQLLNHEEVENAVVVVRKDHQDDNFMCAYYVSPMEMGKDELTGHLAHELPEYMIPQHFIQLEKIPLTPNGKVDRKALPVPGIMPGSSEYIPPRDKIEEKLASIWSEVLHITAESVGIDDDFFELGGHSLNATILMAKIHKELGVKVPLVEIFKIPSIRGISIYIDTAKKEDYNPVKVVEEKEYYPLSSAQSRFYILQQVSPGSTAYNTIAIQKVDGHVEKERFDDALNQLIKRHAGFRTSFEIVAEEPVQRVHENVEFKLEYFDLDAIDANEREEKNKNTLIREFVRPFDLSQPPLMRLRLIEISDEPCILMFDMHHIISDGTSMAVFFKEFMTYYSGGDFQPLQLQYKDFAQWQYDRLASGELGKQEAYWLGLFSGELPVLNMVTDFPRPPEQSFEGGKLYFKLEKPLNSPLNDLIKKTGTTLFMVLLAVYNVLLNRYTGQQDIIIGTTIAGRSHTDLENIIGLLIETLALRNNPQGEQTFEEFLNQVRQRTLNAYENQDYPFKELIKKVGAGNEISRNPVFDAMLIVQNMEITEFELHGLQFSPYQPPKGEEQYMSKVDFTLDALEKGEEIYFNLEYCSRLYKRETMERFARHFINIIREVVAEPGIHLSAIPIISQKEKQQLLEEFNTAPMETEFDSQKTVLDRFEEQVERTPNNIALVGIKSPITYSELNNRADRLAFTLTKNGVKPDTIVAIMVEPSLDMIIGLWGILKAGGAYLPIDPDYPQERIHFMLRDSGTKIIVTNGLKLNGPDSLVVIKPGDVNGFHNHQTAKPPNHQTILAYIIYTSGSTGRPKGVLVEHSNLTAYIDAFEKEFDLRPRDTVIQQVSYAFDAFVEELYPILVKGGKLTIPGRDVNRDIHRLCHFISRQQVTMITCSPQLLSELNGWQPRHLLASLRIIISGGDRLKAEYIDNLLETGEVYNTYGPTESTVCATYYKCPAVSPLPSNVPIGKPIANYQVFVLDKYHNLLPIGVGGELCVSGAGVTRGYLNQPELTNEKFEVRSSKFEVKARIVLYHTGDFARWLPDGNIEFLGRIDHQVKIRGFRIELGEIESHLLAHDEVESAIAIVRIDNRDDNFLCAYLTSFRQIGNAELKTHLSRQLPEYMIPLHFIQLESIPLTANGNVDIKALPAPDRKSEGPLIPPENDTQEKLASIWSQVLGIEAGSLGIDSDFFQLGGHSLNATRAISRIYKELDVKIPLSELFKSPSIRELARFIGDHIIADEPQGFQGISPAEKKEYYPLSSAQRRLYILQQMEPESIAYNGLEAIILEGALDANRLEESLGLLMERHETLRTSIRMVNAEPVQVIQDAGEVDLSVAYYEAGGVEQAAVKEETCRGIMDNFVCPFDLSHAPFLRLGVIKLGEDRYVIMFDIHHIVTDGLSHEIFVKELMSLYTGVRLPELPIQYKDYSQWQNSPRYQATLANQESWWLSQFQTGDDIPVLVLPYDFPRPVVQQFEGDTIYFQLSGEETGALRKIASAEGATLYMVLLALFNVLLFKLSSQEDIVVGAPVAGRPHADLESIMGIFVNTLPLRNYPAATKTLHAFLRQLKESSLNAFENQDYQFENLVDKVVDRRDTSRNPLFDAVFVLQIGMLEPAGNKEISLPGLTLKPYGIKNKSSKFDLTLDAFESGETLLLDFEYSTSLFQRETLERFVNYFRRIVSEVIRDLHQEIGAVEVISDDEKHLLLYEFNQTAADYPQSKTIHQLFEEQVERTPGRTAVAGLEHGASLTYEELNETSNRLAELLRVKGVKPGDIVGVIFERSIDMVTAILGTLKAGGAYLPIDPEYPEERIDYMMKDSGTKIIVTNGLKVNGWDGLMAGKTKPGDANEFPNRQTNKPTNQQTNLAYIIYTSGSTGRPKGVMVEHKSVANLLFALSENYLFGSEDTYLLKTPFVFDVSVSELFGWFMGGGRLAVLEAGGEKDPHIILEAVKAFNVTHINFVPAAFNRFIDLLSLGNADQLSGLKYIFLAGEALPVKLVNKFNRLGTGVPLENLYGPTEAVVYASFYSLRCWDGVGAIAIGKPLPNIQLYILNPYDGLQPIGIPGELCIAGAGVARGYLNRPELTAEKFDKDSKGFQDFKDDQDLKKEKKESSASSEVHEVIYRTGDLARWLEDGNIQFLGRDDQQVKIRGFRVELEEIESKLLNHDHIKEAVVVMKEDKEGDNYLCAYVVPVAGDVVPFEGEIDVERLRMDLSQTLPAYMIPSLFVFLDHAPLTISGKIDRKALPAPVMTSSTAYAGPRSPVEEKLVEIWSELLDIPTIGIDDNFFGRGGHSLNATLLISKIHKALQVEIPMTEIFKHQTIRELSGYMEVAGKSRFADIEAVEKREYYALSSAQKRLYFLQQVSPNSTSYNMPLVLPLGKEVEKNKLELTLKKLIARHESLRTSFTLVTDEPMQRVYDDVEFGIEFFGSGEPLGSPLNGNNSDSHGGPPLQDFIRPFDLGQAPLMRSALIRRPDGHHTWVVDMHHIVSDGTSSTILTQDFIALYTGKELKPLKLQYKEF
ncbi:MAG: amino acid adenylation domain-containing protein, partial [bacterium]|nr:amino acid adenylation domain-containing protein [bacterium]